MKQILATLRGCAKDGWKYITQSNGPTLLMAVNIESGNSPQFQLYNLKEDPKELDNLATKYPKKIEVLKELLWHVKAEH